MTRIDWDKDGRKQQALKRFWESLRGPRPDAPQLESDDRVVGKDELLDGKQIATFQKEANGTLHSPKELRLAYQKIACSCLQRLGEDRDIRNIRQMFNNMPESLPKNRMASFLSAHGPILTSHDENGAIDFHFSRKGKMRLGHALEQPWWMSKP